jgi:hypothetical protein
MNAWCLAVALLAFTGVAHADTGATAKEVNPSELKTKSLRNLGLSMAKVLPKVSDGCLDIRGFEIVGDPGEAPPSDVLHAALSKQPVNHHAFKNAHQTTSHFFTFYSEQPSRSFHRARGRFLRLLRQLQRREKSSVAIVGQNPGLHRDLSSPNSATAIYVPLTGEALLIRHYACD